MTEAESIATTIDCDLSVHQYNTIRKRANKKGRKVFFSYSKIADYKRKKCTPKNIRTPTEVSIEVDLQDAMNHQALKMLTPKVKEKLVKLKALGATFILFFKYGRYYN